MTAAKIKALGKIIGFLLLTILLAGFAWLVGFVGSTNNKGDFRISAGDRVGQLVFLIAAIMSATTTVRAFMKLKSS